MALLPFQKQIRAEIHHALLLATTVFSLLVDLSSVKCQFKDYTAAIAIDVGFRSQYKCHSINCMVYTAAIAIAVGFRSINGGAKIM